MSQATSVPPEPPETIEIESPDVSCDGGGALGHPKVYLTVDKNGRVECPYCDRLFVLKPDASTGSH